MSRMDKRRLLAWAAAGAACVAAPALAQTRRVMARMTEGPFYPPASWRERWSDQDADLTRVAGIAQPARGEHLGLEAVLADAQGRPIDGATIEIWQCDAAGVYRHPSVHVDAGEFDAGFQGFGSTRSDRDGRLRLRTIRPVPYPGRTPHIHIRMNHASFGTFTTQLFVAGEAANARDGLYRRLSADARTALEMVLQPAPADSGLRWLVRQELLLPA